MACISCGRTARYSRRPRLPAAGPPVVAAVRRCLRLWGVAVVVVAVVGERAGVCGGARARGGARSVGFHNPPQPPIPGGMVWNMIYDVDRFNAAHPAVAKT